MANRSLLLWRRRSFLFSARNFFTASQAPPSLCSSSSDISHKVYNQVLGLLNTSRQFSPSGSCYIHTSNPLCSGEQSVSDKYLEVKEIATADERGTTKLTRKKLKGRTAVVKWMKYFRWKKKKEYQRMTAEEKILYKLKKARMREDRFVQALKKIDPHDPPVAQHDPEVLTPEEYFHFLKMGRKCKNYVPVGRRGIFQGVILNMHLHWKKHQTLKVIVKTFTPEEVKEIAAELARLSGGIVLEIEEGNEIIMFRGKNYMQPPTEIMSPKVTLSRKKALDKSKYMEKLRAVRRHIPKLEQELEDLHLKMKLERDIKVDPESKFETKITSSDEFVEESFEEYESNRTKSSDTDFDSDAENITFSESENLSDLFETDTEGQEESEKERTLFLDILERYPSEKVEEREESFEEHLRKIADVVKRDDLGKRELDVSQLDEVDRIFLSASTLIKNKR
ncbi:RNA-binding CRS1 / YhbY (CRM) domain protein [Rhynchospora pubera]|uniref:RNA-binding CRS1 / YhbY (CRM) domain protein n=1 Tax=Rhynchospora pubera TaxID=906938 RepID=A0AAV8FG78_9POAL|nr:RNA-binding CRS1 / YhbY (CRM) domain protein [Rhynchospora pubera]